MALEVEGLGGVIKALQESGNPVASIHVGETVDLVTKVGINAQYEQDQKIEQLRETLIQQWQKENPAVKDDQAVTGMIITDPTPKVQQQANALAQVGAYGENSEKIGKEINKELQKMQQEKSTQPPQDASAPKNWQQQVEAKHKLPEHALMP